MRKIYNRALVVCIIAIVVTAFFLLINFVKTKKYQDFHAAQINGKLDTLYRYREFITIDVNKQAYTINTISGPLSNYNQFDAIAKPGDAVYKLANNDTLNLVHQGKVYLYTVKKY